MGLKKFSKYFYNRVSYAGVFLALVIFLTECFLFIVDFFFHGDLYLGLITYVFLPPFLIFGLLLIPAGALWKRRLVSQGKSEMKPRSLVIDPSLPTHRNALFVFITGTFILILMSVIGAYKSFQYTESVKFCGALCHEVMEPEYTTYQKSPHGKVKCVECHIGEGAGWYVRSKLSGARQVFKTIAHSYKKPIETPVRNLRPAEETCKECHWPGKFFGTMDFNRLYYLTQSEESPWRIRMMLNVGGGDHQSYGLHAHMNVDREIYYAAEDDKRQKLTWVKSVDKNGKEEVFVTPKSKWKDTPPPAEAIRKMDCIDCHNRPTHQYVAPYRLLNESLQFGQLDAGIPKIKEKAMEALSKEYVSGIQAKKDIENNLRLYYQAEQSEYYAAHKSKVEEAIQEVVRLFSNNEFPDMKTRWDTNPDNVGHLITPGCFRCHDGEHTAQGDKKISRDCKSCHLIVEQGAPGMTEKNLDGLEFRHPGNVGEDWKEMECTDCHTGGA